ncbi:MAG: EutP/PduV family microcompartment system protein [Lachnospiraceae bacterium]|nr:EutP/PduV family microcompartment system protein [Lachnospiraceae bacterium]
MSIQTPNEEKKKKIILIGRSTAGKTTLCQRINNEELHYYKTQTVQVINKNMIDTPGEYLERRGYRGALVVSSADADIILLVQDATEKVTMFPPLFRSMFAAKPCVGVITKADLASEEEIERAKKFLKDAGAGELYVTSAVTGEGVEQLVKDLHIL